MCRVPKAKLSLHRWLGHKHDIKPSDSLEVETLSKPPKAKTPPGNETEELVAKLLRQEVFDADEYAAYITYPERVSLIAKQAAPEHTSYTEDSFPVPAADLQVYESYIAKRQQD